MVVAATSLNVFVLNSIVKFVKLFIPIYSERHLRIVTEITVHALIMAMITTITNTTMTPSAATSATVLKFVPPVPDQMWFVIRFMKI